MHLASEGGSVGKVIIAVSMLVCSNLFMTFAWYWHLKLQRPGAARWPIVAIVVVSWLIALVEYSIAVPANRIGASAGLNVAQLKIVQEVVALSVFVPFMILFMGERWRWDYLWAILCVIGAVYFVNRGQM
ncbi:MAG: DMT family protein [Kiritimatiellae bacterium]|nr:DMT family protein [Kiritimatiellia bacterium]